LESHGKTANVETSCIARAEVVTIYSRLFAKPAERAPGAIALVWHHLTSIYRSVLDEDIFTLAGSIAYAALLSIFPLLIAVVALLGAVTERANAQQEVLANLARYLPPSAIAMVRETLAITVPAQATTGVLAILGLLWSATAVAGAVRNGLDRVLGARRLRAFWRRKFVEFTMVLLAGGFLSVSVFTATATTLVNTVQPFAAVADPLLRTPIAAALGTIIPWLFSGFAFLIAYRFLPDVRPAWHTVIAGSTVSLLLFEGVKAGFFWYLRTLAEYPAIYGPLVGVVVFMIWVYLVALVLLIGAEVMAELGRLPKTPKQG
jgi:membrane protein